MLTEIKKLLKRQEDIRAKIDAIRKACPHADYTVKSKYNDHDGWSQVTISYYETRECLECGSVFDVKTSEGYW